MATAPPSFHSYHAGHARPARPLVLTMGDPAGIGLDIAISAWIDRAQYDLPPFVLIADPDAVVQRAGRLGRAVALHVADGVPDLETLSGDQMAVIPTRSCGPVVPGVADPAHAPAVIEAIERAVSETVSGAAAALVTNPISKATLYAAGFAHPGHTEFLGVLAARTDPSRAWVPVMMLADEALRVVPLTVHIPLSAVPGALSQTLIETVCRVTAHDLISRFGIASPRLVVAGLNPHAGEGGSLGREEIDLIAPAIQALRAEGLDITGPHSADTLFHAAARQHYDVAICMYHDQALIPLKTLAFDTGVNVTLGLPFVRTSPDHGTAFDIAGSGRASAASLVAALRMAARLASAPKPGSS